MSWPLCSFKNNIRNNEIATISTSMTTNRVKLWSFVYFCWLRSYSIISPCFLILRVSFFQVFSIKLCVSILSNALIKSNCSYFLPNVKGGQKKCVHFLRIPLELLWCLFFVNIRTVPLLRIVSYVLKCPNWPKT